MTTLNNTTQSNRKTRQKFEYDADVKISNLNLAWEIQEMEIKNLKDSLKAELTKNITLLTKIKVLLLNDLHMEQIVPLMKQMEEKYEKLKKENEELKKKEYDNNVKIARYIIQLPEPVRIPEDEDFLSNVEELWRCVLDFGVDENNPNIKPEHYRNWSEFPENGIDN